MERQETSLRCMNAMIETETGVQGIGSKNKRSLTERGSEKVWRARGNTF